MRAWSRLLVAAVVAVLILGACGDDNGESSADDDADGGEMITTDSGLQYEDLTTGDGAESQPGKLVTVHYTGTFEDGTKFDSSVDRGQPFPFVLGQGMVIAGWDEGIEGMKVGGTRRLVIPPDLAYGEEGRPGIPPNSTLVFEVELLEVSEPEQ